MFFSSFIFISTEQFSRDTGVIPVFALVDGSFASIPLKLFCVLPRAGPKLKAGSDFGHVENSVEIVHSD